MESAHTFARDQLETAGMRRKRNYDVRGEKPDIFSNIIKEKDK